jgi:hypothetical protein
VDDPDAPAGVLVEAEDEVTSYTVGEYDVSGEIWD